MKQKSAHGLLLLLLSLAVAGSLSHGAYPISMRQLYAWVTSSPPGLDAISHNVLFNIRLPRVLLGILAGAALGVAGASMQALFRNPLAEPGLIGLSAGASLGAVAAIVLTPGRFFIIAFAAFSGSLMSTYAAYLLGRISQSISGLILAGVALNAMLFSIVGLIILSADDAQLRDLTFWSMGSLAAANWPMIFLLGPLMLAGLIYLLSRWRVLNALLLGEREAQHLGFSLGSTRRGLIICVALTVGPLLAVTGGIGFVGLVMPHIVRMWRGADHRWVMPASALSGALGLTLADWLARCISAPAEIPIGLITSLVGGPFFIWLLLKGRAG